MKTFEERFWEKVHVCPEGCWEWISSDNGCGYGQLDVYTNGHRKHVYAHRLSWEIHNGPIPVGLRVLHKCDNPPCVRPDHLFLGTQKANLHDMATKGRSTAGERCPYHKLQTFQVAEILANANHLTQEALAKQFGVTETLIRLIVVRRRWKHIVVPQRGSA